MPFLAQDPDTGSAVQTRDIGDKYNHRENFECPYCGDELRFRRASKNDDGSTKRRAHFWHTEGVGGSGEAGGCSKGGESPQHERWKEVIGELLAEKYGVDNFHVEYSIHDRVADVAIEIGDGPKRGVVAEYQDKNADKSYLDVTKHYLKFGYSVHWIFNTNSTYDLLFDAKNALSPYCENLYLGQQRLSADELVEFGTELWFDNFEWVVTNPGDFNPLCYSEIGFHASGDYTVSRLGGRSAKEIFVYYIDGDQYDADDRWISPVSDWDDALSLGFSDSSGGGVLAAYPNALREHKFRLRRPLIRPPHTSP